MIPQSELKPAALGMRDVRKVFSGMTVLSGISMEVAAGEIVCLLGQSGCGKTTLLRIAAGLERPTSGTVSLAGWEVAGPDRFLPPELRGVGLMFQDYALFPHLTVLHNVMFGLDALPALRAREIGMAALERVGLKSHAGDYPHMLSGGEQQPTAVVVTHDPVEAMSIADRIVLMRLGRIVQAGTPQDLYDRPRSLFAARFLSDLNEVPGVVRDGAVECRFGSYAAPGIANGDAVVCIRPQSIALRLLGEGAAPAGDEDTGEVLSCRFLGESQRLLVSVEGLEQPLDVSETVTSGRREPGARVALRIDPARVLAFPAMEAEPR
jgi:iron(III) transport system ATP-binding protein